MGKLERIRIAAMHIKRRREELERSAKPPGSKRERPLRAMAKALLVPDLDESSLYDLVISVCLPRNASGFIAAVAEKSGPADHAYKSVGTIKEIAKLIVNQEGTAPVAMVFTHEEEEGLGGISLDDMITLVDFKTTIRKLFEKTCCSKVVHLFHFRRSPKTLNERWLLDGPDALT